MHYFRYGLLAAFMLVVIGCDLGRRQSKKMTPAPTKDVPEGVSEGKRAPEITGEDADGANFKLSDYRGKVVLLDFWFES
jgi:cytochrome oxidase Cu insertion factor (SCO1/SenC/PrrC family)